jgi:Spy/CpxP family protein refolding chaperone
MYRTPHHASNSARRAATVVAAAFAFAVTGVAFGQTPPAPGTAAPHAGHHWKGGGDEDMLAMTIVHAKSTLNLNTSQSQMFDAALAQSKAARQTGHGLRQQVHDALAAELAKPEPDLASVAAVANGARDQGAALRKQVQASWLSLYATFSPDQKNVVKGMLQQHLARMDAMEQKFQQQRATTPAAGS